MNPQLPQVIEDMRLIHKLLDGIPNRRDYGLAERKKKIRTRLLKLETRVHQAFGEQRNAVSCGE